MSGEISWSYKVFISHSTKDKDLIELLSKRLEEARIDCYLAERNLPVGEELKNIFSEIDSSDIVIALLTKDGESSEWVNQEIGYAKKAGKLILPAVEEGLKPKGILEGVKYEPFNKGDPRTIYTAFDKLRQIVETYYKQKKILLAEARKRALQKRRVDKKREEEKIKTALLVLGILFIVLLLSSSK